MCDALARCGIGLLLALAVGCSRPAAPAGGGEPPAPPGVGAPAAGEEKSVREAVQRFYDTFNSHDWGRVAEFTTEDWTHIDPGGGWTRGREAVLKRLKEV